MNNPKPHLPSTGSGCAWRMRRPQPFPYFLSPSPSQACFHA